jgi:hypothetical protein
VEEAGIDGGGIFKDFMENITRAAFDVQYGLFKVSALLFFSHRITIFTNVRVDFMFINLWQYAGSFVYTC